MEQNVDEYAELMSLEIGKPINQGRGEVKKSAAHCVYFAENAEKWLARREYKTEAKMSYV